MCRAVMKLVVTTLSLVLCSISRWSCNTPPTVTAFVVSTQSMTIPRKLKSQSYQQLRIHRQSNNKSLVQSCMVTNPDDDGAATTTYDLSKPIYDLYAFRMVRGDAIIQYNLRNQSEPLRINLALIGTLFLICLPSLITEFSGASNGYTVVPTTMPLITPDLSVAIPQTIASWLGAIGCLTFGIQQAQKRNKQLLRIEKECVAGDLSIQLPMTWIASDRPYQTQPQSIRNVIKGKSCRILAMSGPASELQRVLQNELMVYNRRWKQSNTYWILIPNDVPNTTSEQQQRTAFISQSRYPWLAQAYDYDQWNMYFQSLQSTDGTATANNDATNKISWFGLSATGRSFGSGATKPASYLQILGNSLSPVDILYNDNEDESQLKKDDGSKRSTETTLLSCQKRFYDALTNGNLTVMKNEVFDTEMDSEVTDVIQQGGRLDPWEICLLADAKPTGMTISDCEVILTSPENDNHKDGTNHVSTTTTTTAYTTCIEFPVDNYMGGVIPTLLAVQKWKKIVVPSATLSATTTTNTTTGTGTNSTTVEEWKLVQHQTIPWTSERAAGGTLLCDGRGCVALVRSTATSNPKR